MTFKDKRVVQIDVKEFLALLGFGGEWTLEQINPYNQGDAVNRLSVTFVVMKDWEGKP